MVCRENFPGVLADGPADGVRIKIADGVGEVKFLGDKIDADARGISLAPIGSSLRLKKRNQFIGVTDPTRGIVHLFASENAVRERYFPCAAEALSIVPA